jgi:hypothetical protein
VNSPWDDAICPKSSYALGNSRPTENVTISDCFVTGTYELGSVIAGSWKKFADDAPVLRQGRIKCGTESNGGFRNIALTNNLFEGCKGIALGSSDGALIEDIVDAPLFLRLNRRNCGPKGSMRPGTVRRVMISNIVSHNAAASTSSLLVGIPENLIEDVKIANCFFGHQGLPKTARVGFGETSKPMPDWRTMSVPEIEDAYPETLFLGPTPCHCLFARHLKNLEMAHVEFAPANSYPRPAFWLEDVHRADFLAVAAPPQPNFQLRNVTDLRIAFSSAAKDNTIPSAVNELI